ncbi:MAG: exodeoxyribonuclease VII large subunit [Bacilli bacterium]|nr:exodeoxyribonuclease VII large subunit [Bacilli bacterium]
MMQNNEAFSVTALNKYIKLMFDNNFSLRNLTVKGEISNLKKYPSGHVYFSLKDEESVIKAVMFYDYAKHLNQNIKDGDEVLVTGNVSVYPSRGEYQIYAVAMELNGAGAQLLELELLKKKLAAEGLFDISRKRKINIFPKSVGVICAPNSAAMADIVTNLLRRFPLVEVKKFPSLVQGSEAVKSLLNALNEAKNSNLDTLIIGRGGGASEDLSAFNDETLVRKLANFPVPTISAVGHEIDFTLIDYVADARASTPTGAAELATVDKREIFQKLDHADSSLTKLIEDKNERYRSKLESISKRPFFINPKTMYIDKLKDLKIISDKLNLVVKHLIDEKINYINSQSKHLHALSPNGVLKRGYSILQNENGAVINSTSMIKLDSTVKTVLADGIITSKVIKKESKNG